ncbi:MAG: TerB family tellurite resistance protein [Cyclobacteriaceae bacterium]
MVEVEEVYEAFGELLYAVAMADGEIQDEEVQVLNKMLADHQFAKEIKWSFNYETQKATSVTDAYEKALSTMVDFGPFEDYSFLFDALEKVAHAFQGIMPEEQELIENFRSELESQLGS